VEIDSFVKESKMEIMAAAYRWEVDGEPRYAFRLNEARGGLGSMKIIRVRIDSGGMQKVGYFGRLVGLREPNQSGFYTLQELVRQGRVFELNGDEGMSRT
jgi:hypothetical protein